MEPIPRFHSAIGAIVPVDRLRRNTCRNNINEFVDRFEYRVPNDLGSDNTDDLFRVNNIVILLTTRHRSTMTWHVSPP